MWMMEWGMSLVSLWKNYVITPKTDFCDNSLHCLWGLQGQPKLFCPIWLPWPRPVIGLKITCILPSGFLCDWNPGWRHMQWQIYIINTRKIKLGYLGHCCPDLSTLHRYMSGMDGASAGSITKGLSGAERAGTTNWSGFFAPSPLSLWRSSSRLE